MKEYTRLTFGEEAVALFGGEQEREGGKGVGKLEKGQECSITGKPYRNWAIGKTNRIFFFFSIFFFFF